MTPDTISQFEILGDEQLHNILRDDVAFTEKVVLAMPALASDAGFDLYGKEWINRYWKNLIIEVQGGLTSEGALHWALEATAGTVAAAIAKRFDLPESTIPAAAAMAILIVRAAKAEHSKRSAEFAKRTKHDDSIK